uniref:Uncharacterized protein n=1 Tax=Cacopsylla melanoneura TaxID=428564 RepID=A0A8D8YL08_9HEMI
MATCMWISATSATDNLYGKQPLTRLVKRICTFLVHTRDIVHVGVHCTTQYSTGNIIYLRKILILVTTTRALLTLVSAWVPRYKLIQVACYQRTQRNITKGNWLSVICPVQNMTKKPTF